MAPWRCSVTTATWRTSRGPVGRPRPRRRLASPRSRPARGGTLLRLVHRDSAGFAPAARRRCVRGRRSASFFVGGGGGSLSRASRATSCAIAASSVARRRALCLRDERSRDRGRSSRPVGKRSSRSGASAFITISSSSGGTSRAYVLGGSTKPERTMSRSASPPRPAVKRATREDLPEDDAERVEVASPVDVLAARLLGRHVPELAFEDARSSVKRLRARDAEVGDLHRAFERQENVLRAHVAVDDLERLRPLRPSSRARSADLWPLRRSIQAPTQGGIARPLRLRRATSAGRGRSPRRTPSRGAGPRRRRRGTRRPGRRSGD